MTTCEHCVYWKPEHSGWGWCHRKAPEPTLTTGMPTEDTFSLYAFWPMTSYGSECGEGKTRE